ncbi:MAG: GspH/FimT family pseudopilin [Gemmatimonadales bacterium]
MNRGVTLPELLVALVLIGLLACIGVPRIAAVRNGILVREEALHLLAALDQARGAAIRIGSNTRLTLADSGYSLVATAADSQVVLWRAPGPAGNAVQLSGAGAPLLFGPAGLAVGASNRTLLLRRGSVTRTVVISRLGRISG